MTSFGKYLKEQRVKAGYTQKQAATRALMSETQYQKYEQGVRQPSFDTAVRLSKAIGFSLDDAARATTIVVVFDD